MIVHIFETYSLLLLALWKKSNVLSVKKFEGSVKFTIALWSHHSHMISQVIGLNASRDSYIYIYIYIYI